MDNQKLNNQVAECVGLWLAEGDKKCNNEINFSNNCFSLINLFDKTIRNLFKEFKFNIRVYIYTPKKENITLPIRNCKINRYIDKQATKPYFIWRLASVELNKNWKKIVEEISNNPLYYADVLRGFFAGEGNIKTSSHKNRTIRLFQSKPIKVINNALDNYQINYKYCTKEKGYIITSKTNWDKCAEIKIADLHPIRKKKFWATYNDFKEEHYSHNYLKKEILNCLSKPFSSKELSIKYNRSQARIYDVLDLLKKEEHIENFRVKSKDYWIKKL